MMQFYSLLAILILCIGLSSAQAESPNILIITVDDMSADSLGAFGCELADTSPTVDALAESGLRFKHAHVVVGNCKPSRNVMWSGRYPHNNGVEGFYSNDNPDYPVLCDLMKANGYYAGIRGKVSHSTPYHPYAWDRDLTILPDGRTANMKDAETYYDSMKTGIEEARKAGEKFCLMINISDPHKPFYAQAKGGETWDDPDVPSRVFTAEEVPVPRFLADGPETRKELAHYYSSVRRADDCVAATLRALDDLGERENTFILFLSDHGMPLPFAKTQIYHHSTNTPLIAVWPGVTKAGKVDQQHMFSAVDFLPTLLDVAGIEHPEGLDGKSFLPAIRGEKQEGRDFVIKEYNENAGASRDPMRSVQTKEFAYIYNPWSNGERIMATATQGTQTYREMQELAKTDEYVAGRLRLIDHRVPEEFYHYAKDPDGLHNLIDDPKYAEEITRHREMLEAWMVESQDHALEVFRNRDDPAAREAYVLAKEAESAARRASKKGNAKAKKNVKLIRLLEPKEVAAGEAIVLRVAHMIPEEMGEQMIHVTIKGDGQKRIDRKVVTVFGKGTARIEFDAVGSDVGEVNFSAFIGEEYSKSLQHLTSKPVEVK